MKSTLSSEEVATLADQLQLNSMNVVEAITPENVAEAKAFFIDEALAHRFPNIEFKYDFNKLRHFTVHDAIIESMRQHILDSLVPESPADNAIKTVLDQRFDQYTLANHVIAGIANQSTEQTTNAVRALYGTVSNQDFIEAVRRPLKHGESALLTPSECDTLGNISLDAPIIAYYFRSALNYCGILNWSVDIGNQYSSIDARDTNHLGHPILGIPTDRTVSALKLVALIGHEINCHVRNVENSRAWFASQLGPNNALSPLIPFLSKSFNEQSYEGVAKFSDHLVSGEVPSSNYIMTIAMAQNANSWSQVASYTYNHALAQGNSPEKAAKKAWIRTFRTLRGATNTAQTDGYAFTKDAGYLLGYKRIKELLQINPLYSEYASISESDTNALLEANALGAPLYRNRNPDLWVAHQILADIA